MLFDHFRKLARILERREQTRLLVGRSEHLQFVVLVVLEKGVRYRLRREVHHDLGAPRDEARDFLRRPRGMVLRRTAEARPEDRNAEVCVPSTICPLITS